MNTSTSFADFRLIIEALRSAYPWSMSEGNYSTPSISSSTGFYLLGIVIVYQIWQSYIYPNYFSELRTIPQPKTDWATWLFRWMIREPLPPELLTWAQHSPNNGFLRYTSIGGSSKILLLQPEAIKEVFGAQSYTSFMVPAISREMVELTLGRGLVWAEGDLHRLQKRKLGPAFANKSIKALYPVFWKKSMELTTMLKNTIASSGRGAASNEKCPKWIDVTELLHRTTLDIIGVAAWGTDFNALQDPDSNFYKTYSAAFRPRKYQQILADALLLVPATWLRYSPSGKMKAIVTAMEAAREISREAIRKEKDIQKYGSDKEREANILSIAMQSGTFTDKELVEQLVTILAAGHETINVTIFWCIYYLAKHGDMQTRLRQEIHSYWPALLSGQPVDLGIFDNPPYLQAVLNEVFRFRPGVRQGTRIATRNTTVCGQSIPKGTRVVLSAHVLNRLEDIWGPDAGIFNPDRWLQPANGNQAVPKASDMFTFSSGTKVCIGQAYARAELQALLVVLIGHFHFELEYPNLEPDVVWLMVGKPTIARFSVTALDV